MFSNYFTLKKYTENFLVKLVGNELLQVYTQRENRLTFEFLDFKTVKRFDFVIHSKLAGFVPQKFLTRSKQAMDFFLSCKNKKITKVFLSEQDRLIFLELSNSQTIVLRIFGKDSNVFLLEKDRISDAFKKLNFVPNEKFEIKKRSGNVFPQDSFQSWFTAFQAQKVSAEDFLKQNVNFLGKTFFNEILFRSNEKTLETFYLTTQELLVEIDFCKPKIYLKDGLPFKFSLCELKSLGEFESKNAENLEDALEYFYRVSERNEAFENRKNHCLKLLSTKLKSLKKSLTETIEIVGKPSEVEKFKRFGELILTYFHELKKGQTSVVLADFETGNGVTIPLNQTFTPSENADFYFKKSRREERTFYGASKRLEELEREFEPLEKLYSELLEVKNFRELEKTEQELLKFEVFTVQNVESVKLSRQIIKKYREFLLPGNWRVIVGRNANENDEITLKVAKKEDWFFHFYGGSGSHVILCQGSHKENPSQKIIEMAGSLAAFYSEGKKSLVSPVVYTRVKHVTKPRKAKKGLVSLKFEKIVYVEPKGSF